MFVKRIWVDQGYSRTCNSKTLLNHARYLPLLLSMNMIPQAFAATPPSSGTILQQTTPPSAAPTAPAKVLTLPPPAAQKGAAAKVKIPVRKISLAGNKLLPTTLLTQQLQDLIGRTVTLNELRLAVARITAVYHAHGYPLAYAYLPAQAIHKGDVKIAVVEPRYDRIDLQNTSHLKSTQATRVLSLHAGEPVAAASLDRGLLLLHRTPGVRVAGTLVPGAEPGTSTLQVKLGDTPRLRVATSLDNYGNVYTGRTRAGVNLSLDNPFGYGGQLAVNGLTTEAGLLHAGGFNIVSPDLGNGLRAGLYGSKTDYRLGGAFANLQQRGDAKQLGFDLGYPMILRPGRLLSVQLDVMRNTLDQQSASAGTDIRTHVTLTRLSINGAYADHQGGVTSGGLSFSRGTLGLDSADAMVADAAGPNAAGEFSVVQGQVAYQRTLPLHLKLRLSLSGQVANNNLDGSQKFYLGGPAGVMSYPVGEAGGDQGLLLTARLAHRVPAKFLPGQMDAALLVQTGEVWVNHDMYAGATGSNRIRLSGLGLGLDYQWQDQASAQLAYVRRLGNTQATAGPDHKGELWARLQLNF